MTRLETDGYYKSEGGCKVVATRAGLAEEVRARGEVMKTQTGEADMLRARGMKFNREKLEYRKKLMEEKEKAACLMQHAAS